MSSPGKTGEELPVTSQMYSSTSVQIYSKCILNGNTMYPPDSGWKNRDEIPTFQHTRVEVELDVDVVVELRVGSRSCWGWVGVELGSWSRVGFELRLRRSRVGRLELGWNQVE